MRRSVLLVPAILIAFLVLGAAAVYAYDSARSDMIADGVTAAGVDLGGLQANEARARLEDEVARPLQKPVRVKAAGKRYKLSPRRAGVDVDVDALVEEALAESRDGDILTRTWRGLTGGDVKAELPVATEHSREAVAKLVERVSKEVDRPAQDASVEPSSSGLDTVPAHAGRRVAAGRLEGAITEVLDEPGGDRTLTARIEKVQPSVTEDQLAGKYPYYITIDRSSFTLRFFRNLKLDSTYDIAVGQAGYDTPVGLYSIQDKQVNPAWHVPQREWAGKLAGQVIPGGASNNPLRARWMGIYNGAGIHGTNDEGSIGSAASHGCIRMRVPDVIELYDKVEVGTPVYIG